MAILANTYLKQDGMTSMLDRIIGQDVLQHINDFAGYINDALTKYIFGANASAAFRTIIGGFVTIGYAMIVLFFVVELVNKITNDRFSLNQFFALMVKLVIAYALVTYAMDLFTMLFRAGNFICTYVASAESGLSTGDASGGILGSVVDEYNNIGPLKRIPWLIMMAFPWVISWIAELMYFVLIIGRAIELIIRVLFAPVAMANAFREGESSAVKYIRQFLSCVLHLALIYGVLMAQTLLAGAVLTSYFKDADIGNLWIILIILTALQVAGATTALRSRQLSDAVCGV